ncbi:Threonine/homoserine/homoserine lactone efflux protein [Rhizobium sp. NFR07]|uniref:LysE family translocator n=1 Tax=Rhizobium sp. NFR07 TaxID=1566262 RepID=UPI0008E4ECE8|nr:LysE family translocator [Rhizobium sp. NFR07]SFB61144.1 Threonine/homoserine/homoserine lactone efflux protein [Rhizobium sp. NFR07]
MLTNAIPVLISVSLLPGLCMLLALNLGLRIGVGRTLWMMAGELCAVALIATFVLMGISTLFLGNPLAYKAMTVLGSAYLLYVGACVMFSAQPETDQQISGQADSPFALARLGFFVAASNPKAWILYTAMLPALLLPQRPLMPQALQLVALLVVIELASLLLYASGGQGLRFLLARKEIARFLNIALGGLIMLPAIALLVSA